jgi:hypothetical protein
VLIDLSLTRKGNVAMIERYYLIQMSICTISSINKPLIQIKMAAGKSVAIWVYLPSGKSLLLLKHSETHNLIDGNGVGKGPENSHDDQTAQNVLAFEGGWAQPDEMENEYACSQTVVIVQSPLCVSQFHEPFIHEKSPNFNYVQTSIGNVSYQA